MMTTRPTVDLRWAAQLVTSCKEAYDEYITSDPSAIGQVDHAFAADHALDCATLTYALGADPNDVRTWIKRAAFALGEVFRLRGTTATFAVTVVDAEKRQAATSPAEPDASLTNSRRGLLAMQLALVAGDPALVEHIAAMIGDPPNASYLGPDSVVCTTEEQGLAYAMKAFLLGQTAVAYFHTAGLSGSSSPIREQSVAIDALINRDRGAFLAALNELLTVHIGAARDPHHVHEPRYLIAIPVLALAAIAIGSGMIEQSSLPEDPYLPRALLPPLAPEA
jgi:hypothetical protein